MASESNAKVASKVSPVAQTPLVAKARRVVMPSAARANFYSVGDTAVVLNPKRVGTITELTNSGSGAISATIKIDTEGDLVKATLDPSDDFWYPPPKQPATLFFPGVEGATVTLAHQRLPHTVQAPKPVPREALGLPPLPVGACDSNPVDENNAAKGKRHAVVQNKGKAAQGTNKAIPSSSEATYTATQNPGAPTKEVSKPPVSSSDPTPKSADDVSNKHSATTSLTSGSPLKTEIAGSTSTDLSSTATKNMTPRAQPATKRKRDGTVGDASKKPKTDNSPSTAGETLGEETLGDGSMVVNNNYNGGYTYHISGNNCTLQLPPVPTSQVISGGHQHAPCCYDQYPTFVPQPVAQGATPCQRAPMPYQALQAGNPLAPYSATHPFAPPFVPGATVPLATYYRPAGTQNPQASPYTMDTRFRDQASSVASSSRGPGSYYRQNT